MLNKSKKIMAVLIAVTILIPGVAQKALAAESGEVVRLQGPLEFKLPLQLAGKCILNQIL